MTEVVDKRHGMPVYTYHGFESIERAIQQEFTAPPKEGAVATHFVMEDVPSETIKYLLTSDNVQLPSNTDISAYDISAHRVTIEMPGYPPHSTAVMTLSEAISRTIREAGFQHEVLSEGSALHHTSDRGKLPDGCWSLRPPNLGEAGETWPRIVLEVGLSEPENKIKEDARFWLDSSDGIVKLMVTVVIAETTATMEVWQLGDGDVVVVGRMKAEVRDGTWRLASEINALRFPVEDVFNLPPKQGRSEVLILHGDDLVNAAEVATYQKMMWNITHPTS